MAGNIFHDGRPLDKKATAERFRSLRRLVGERFTQSKKPISQERLGTYIGVCRPTVSNIERGVVFPYGSTMRRFNAYEAKHRQPPRVFPEHWH